MHQSSSSTHHLLHLSETKKQSHSGGFKPPRNKLSIIAISAMDQIKRARHVLLVRLELLSLTVCVWRINFALCEKPQISSSENLESQQWHFAFYSIIIKLKYTESFVITSAMYNHDQNELKRRKNGVSIFKVWTNRVTCVA